MASLRLVSASLIKSSRKSWVGMRWGRSGKGRGIWPSPTKIVGLLLSTFQLGIPNSFWGVEICWSLKPDPCRPNKNLVRVEWTRKEVSHFYMYLAMREKIGKGKGSKESRCSKSYAISDWLVLLLRCAKMKWKESIRRCERGLHRGERHWVLLLLPPLLFSIQFQEFLQR